MEKLNLVNGNKQNYTIDLPNIVILDKFINDVALEHIAENTGLNFIKTAWNYEAQPVNSKQIASLLLSYNFKSQYHNNATNKNTLFLRFCRYADFDNKQIAELQEQVEQYRASRDTAVRAMTLTNGINVFDYINTLKDKLHRRNLQIADLKKKNQKLYDLLVEATEWASEVISDPNDSPTMTKVIKEFDSFNR